MSDMRKAFEEISLIDGQPCGHAGCLHHVSHPCEGCGRIAGRRVNSSQNHGLNNMSNLWHVLPVNDLREHDTKLNCWCNPVLGDGVVLHNSMDERESYEKGRELQ